MTYTELAEQVATIQQQARALVGQTSALLRTLEPLVAQEQDGPKERPRPRVFGQPKEERNNG